jgi:hypothetical protein
MKKAIKLFGIIAFVAIIGFSMVSCGSETEANNGIVKVYNEPGILNTYTTATMRIHNATKGLGGSDHMWLITVGSPITAETALGLGSTVTVGAVPTGVGLCVVVDDGHIGSTTGKTYVTNSDRFVLSKDQTITFTYDGFFVEIDK